MAEFSSPYEGIQYCRVITQVLQYGLNTFGAGLDKVISSVYTLTGRLWNLIRTTLDRLSEAVPMPDNGEKVRSSHDVLVPLMARPLSALARTFSADISALPYRWNNPAALPWHSVMFKDVSKMITFDGRTFQVNALRWGYWHQ